MNPLSNKILAIFMVVVVLFSTTSFAITKHFCGDSLVDTAVFSKAKTCGMEKNSSIKFEDCSIVKKDCCSNQQILIEGQDELQFQASTLSFGQQVFITSFIYTYINLFEGFDKEINSFREYKPPLVVKQIFKIDETYLI